MNNIIEQLINLPPLPFTIIFLILYFTITLGIRYFIILLLLNIKK